MIPPRYEPKQDNVDSWLMSYADMITLLLCFFVIFVAVSEPKKAKFDAIADGIAHKFSRVELSLPFQEIYKSFEKIVETRQVLKDVAIDKSDTAIVIELTAGPFYKYGMAQFNDEKLPVLTDFAAEIKNAELIGCRISVEGYTSDVEPNPGIYPSNWEFSTARAARMVRFFIDNGVLPQHLSAVGYGSTRPEVPNLDQRGQPIEDNRKKNDRIIIRLERVL